LFVFLNYYFSRNGNDLGIAFDNVPCGRGIAYFPAISLSQNERVKINFGSTPFRHPTLNYLPIDEKPQLFIEQADFLLNIFEQVIYLGKYQKFYGSNKNTNSLKVISCYLYLNFFFIFSYLNLEQYLIQKMMLLL
jgi:hypothetical protein